MAWLWAVVAGIGVGAPLAAWWLGRSARSAPLSVPGRSADPIDRWLFDRYGLGVLDRWQVRDAVFRQGSRPSQPSLRAAADGVATEVVSGRLQGPRAARWLGWYFVAYGLCFCAGGITRHEPMPGLLDFLGGAGAVLLGVASLVMVPRQLRRKARMALNGEVSS